jgi:hypothetical protein
MFKNVFFSGISNGRELFMNGVDIKPVSPNSTQFIYWAARDYIAF